MVIVVAVRDVKADAFGMPICFATEGLATRGFVEACRNPEAPMHQYPADYMMYKIGSYDANSGKMEALPIPELLMTAVDAVGRHVEVKAEAAGEAH